MFRDGSPRGRVRGERGSTLVEQLIAVAIMGTSVVAMMVGAGAIYASSAINRSNTTAGVVARDYAEAIEYSVSTGGWCSNSYTTSYTPPTGYSVSANYGACPSTSAGTPQFQTVTVTATAPNGQTETVRNVVREP